MGVTTVRLQDDIEQEVQAIADKLHRSKGWVIKQALSEFIEKRKLEQQRWNETLQAMEFAAQGNVVPGDTVHDWLASWGTEGEEDKKGPLE
ncbi:CopG family ribbon-helix-helix protein [Pseudidiomarina terrestris]|uniref:Ribbon-helix-helix protein, CopG family n=1 Tax=Pseudidiomarina terrestris TaxID=2820060 RepID=A0AAW7R0R1_9GAMM|nr:MULTISPECIES: ribbon-helix-helix protein, CopG family [unclassified Pseudidiomarina]MDN7125609.1 ribbon-helix-helix protein, CopG family [Pseudidiomarina sp. 1APP75-32.1]MDN7126141.1 ribbon-helix-helix protein, CopG family [Pseudidiomarina sp. 1APR75-33.1]MDN7130527.1 ribbon-helix-helix protein, CopG family [Pseudidiomarina sp. 1APR75-15]MDN7134169.1 ribbon-helix-helix protein, CopG family [Pseudidiomarina sp. 1ASP75-5]MDN7137144.1 ribbon-helix-helix protein, CopG family [Pseudidiomarina sp